MLVTFRFEIISYPKIFVNSAFLSFNNVVPIITVPCFEVLSSKLFRTKMISYYIA
jgi:hypothetical protein